MDVDTLNDDTLNDDTLNDYSSDDYSSDDYSSDDYSSEGNLDDHSTEVKNNKWDGGVKQVEDYLKMTLRDPDSYEGIEWSEVKEKEDGYYVRHKYRAKNGFGGYVVANQLFHLDFNGNVVDVTDLY